MMVPKVASLLLRTRCWRSFATSTLFISDRSTKERPILTPTLNLEAKFKNVQVLQDNLKARRMDVDAISLKHLWEAYNELKSVRTIMEQRRVDIADQMNALRKGPNSPEKDSMEKLRLEGRIVRDDLKRLLQVFWEVEEKLMIKCLHLPNDLHPKTPIVADEILEELNINSKHGEKSHLEFKNLLDYRAPQCYYLKNDAALFDLALAEFFRSGLRNAGYIGLNGPDFSHSAVLEACGSLLKSHARLEPLKDNLHLVGGASIYSLCIFYAKQNIPVNNLPIRHYTVGRNYAIREGSGLLGAWQRNLVKFLSIVGDSNELEVEFENTASLLTSFYKSLEWDFRLVYISAPNLQPWESLRLSVQMYSYSARQWVEVGNASISNSFIPERVSMKFEREDKSKDVCHLISGTAVDVTAVLACRLEQCSSNLFPAKLTPYMVC